MSDMTDIDELLVKTRTVSRALQNTPDTQHPDYQELAVLLSSLTAANTYILSRDGRVLGCGWPDGYECPIMAKILESGFLPEEYMETLNAVRESEINVEDHNKCSYSNEPCRYTNKQTIYTPIYGMGERLGTLLIGRFGKEFDTKDLVLAEYLATVVGLGFLNERGRDIEERGRERLVVQMAMKALSFSEIESIKHIIEDLDGPDGGVVVASRVADRAGVTRSVIVNALRKLGSAGIIESRSLGMKGTYIRISSTLFLDEIGVWPKGFKRN